MASIGKPKIQIKKSDINQAILKRNKSLDARNNRLDENIKNKENDIKSLDKEIKSLNNEIKSLIEIVSNNKTLLSKENIKLHNLSTDMKNRESHILTLKNEESSINNNVEKLNKEALKLKDDIAYLETKQKKAEDLIEDVDSLESTKQNKESEIDALKRKYRTIKEDISNQESYFKDKSIEYKKEIVEMSDDAQKLSAKIKVIQTDVDNEQSKHSFTCSKLDEEKKEKSLELKAVESLINKKEDEYITWERKLENLQISCDSENKRITKVKENFEKWKVNVLEEVARMKLKGKMEKIDKAGLGEILNG